MIRIWKFQFPVHDFELTVPFGSKILCVQSQRDEPCIWFEVPQYSVDEMIPENASLERRQFCVQLTGISFEREKMNYIGTFQLNEGRFVGHLYEFK